jgi:pyruvate dehydrogenase E2 component (dihydrolipoamide acetyltransferase)
MTWHDECQQVIAKRLSESKQTVPHQYTSMEIEIDALLALRKTLKNEFGVNISVNDVVIKSAAMALRDVPECNGKWVPASGGHIVWSDDMICQLLPSPSL